MIKSTVFDSGNSTTVHKYLKEPNYGTFTDWRQVLCSLKFCERINDVNSVFILKRRVFPLDSLFLAHLLHFGYRVITISVRVLIKTVWAIVNGLLEPFAHSYHNSNDRFGIILLAHRACWGSSDDGSFDGSCFSPHGVVVNDGWFPIYPNT